MESESLWERLLGEAGQAWAIFVKDIRVYYATPPMIMFGLLMPFFMFFSFTVKRNMPPGIGIARLLALTTFFTASSAGPVIIPLERRVRTYDRLLAAPMSLLTLIVSKMMVGAFFGTVVSIVPLLAGVIVFGVMPAHLVLTLLTVILSSVTFAGLGLLFASWPTQSVGSIMMPSTLIRWPLLFISGVFIPLEEMSPLMRALSFASPLTYAQDLMNHAVVGGGAQSTGLDLAGLIASWGLFLIPTIWMHHWSRKLGY